MIPHVQFSPSSHHNHLVIVANIARGLLSVAAVSSMDHHRMVVLSFEQKKLCSVWKVFVSMQKPAECCDTLVHHEGQFIDESLHEGCCDQH